MPRNCSRGLSFLFCSLGLFIGCASTSKVKPPDLTSLTPEDIQSRVFQNFQKLDSFAGKARVIIELPGEGYNGYSNIFVDFPDSIFIKTEAILGIDIGALFLDNRYFAAYAPRENILYYGETASFDLRDFLQVEIETDELTEVFTGLTQVVTNDSSTLEFEDGEFLISTIVEEGMLKYRIEPEKYVVTNADFMVDGETVLVKDYSRFRDKKNIDLPQIIRVTRPQARERITVYYTSQKINEDISPEKFKITASKNARKVYWGDLKTPKIERGPREQNRGKPAN